MFGLRCLGSPSEMGRGYRDLTAINVAGCMEATNCSPMPLPGDSAGREGCGEKGGEGRGHEGQTGDEQSIGTSEWLSAAQNTRATQLPRAHCPAMQEPQS